MDGSKAIKNKVTSVLAGANCYPFLFMGSGMSIRKIEFDGKRFVLTGDFEHGQRDSVVAGFIAPRGGNVSESVSKKVSYVVVGGLGSEAYSMGKYGTKVKKAMDLQQTGCPIRIITESELYGE